MFTILQWITFSPAVFGAATQFKRKHSVKPNGWSPCGWWLDENGYKIVRGGGCWLQNVGLRLLWGVDWGQGSVDRGPAW